MRRRELIALVGGALGTWPFGARAQRKALPVIGFLGSTDPGSYAVFVAAFQRGLSEAGYIEGRNVAIEYRWAEGHYDRLPALAADLVGRKVNVIAVLGGTSSALAAKSATLDDPDRFQRRRRGRARPGRQSRPAGGQPDGLHFLLRRAGAQAARVAVGAGPPGPGDRPAREPEESEYLAWRGAASGAH